MNLKKELLKESYLYVIVDKDTCGARSVSAIAKILKKSGVDIVQYRDKSDKESVFRNAVNLGKLFLKSKTLFIVNDHLDVAKIINSDGIHLGQQDTPLEIARNILGKDKIIGVSCHSLAQAINAQRRGADYIGIGPIFKTPTKPEITKPIGLKLIKQIREKIRIPFFAIGGIDKKNINDVLSSGAKRVAVCSAVCKANNIAGAVRNFNGLLK